MSELLKLAEQYYVVAADMERHARHQLEIAKQLNQHADKLCEQNMREAKPVEKCVCGCLKPAPTYPCGACGRVAVPTTAEPIVRQPEARRRYHVNGTYWSCVPTVDLPCDFCTRPFMDHDPRTHACSPTASCLPHGVGVL